jgi:hypothetical protein
MIVWGFFLPELKLGPTYYVLLLPELKLGPTYFSGLRTSTCRADL